jgi:2-dehydro-3-deoxygalactonokinase
VNSVNQTILSEIKTDYGIASAFSNWKQAEGKEDQRIGFYQSYISEQVKKITASFDQSINQPSLTLSGMASSSIGMMELPYKELPFQCDGSDLSVHTIPAGKNHQFNMIIISGVKSGTDVIRGEETMLAGCDITNDDSHQLFIFPGTHSKHILVRNGIVENFFTYMTGEVFDLLSNKSILSASIKKNAENSINDQHFTDGIIKGASSNIMNSIFHVRTNQLFRKMTPEENFNYLSGLLIGHELKDIAANKPSAIMLVCSEGLKWQYTKALNALALGNLLQYYNADDALINGQLKIMRRNGYPD